MNGLLQDLRYALRAIRRAPGFSAIAVGCLAVAIAVNVSAFSIVDAFVFRDLPGVSKQRELAAVLITIQTRYGRTGPTQLSEEDWSAFQGRIDGFVRSGVTGFSAVALRLGGEPIAARADFVSGSFLTMLGTRPVIGRLIAEEDDRPGAPPVAVVSHHYWQTELGGRPDVIGQRLQIADVAFTIVGVAPEGYVGLYPGELTDDPRFGAPYVILPLATAPLVRADSRYASVAERLDDEWLMFIGRRRAGVTNAEITARANVIAAGIAAEHPRQRMDAEAVVRHPSSASNTELAAIIGSVMALPVLILLIACANLANQLLARGVQRGREIAVRLSLGSSRARLVRLLLMESTVLALLAGAAALALARVLVDVFGTRVMVTPFRIPIDGRVAVFTLAIAFVAAVTFGLVPALRATRLDIARQIKESGSGGFSRSRLRSALVILQVGASVALLAVAGVFTRAADRSRMTEAGPNGDRLLTVAMDLDLAGYDSVRGRLFHAEAMDRLRAIPGVDAVARAPFGAVSTIPEDRARIDGDPPDYARWFDIAAVSGEWFDALNLQPISGRVFEAGTPENSGVAVINEEVAKELWPGGDPLGKTISIGDDSIARIVTVIGVVPAAKRDPRDNGPHAIITIPAADSYDAQARIYVRTSGSATAMRNAVLSVVRELDRDVPIPEVKTLGESVGEVVASAEQIGMGAAAMGVIAVFLATLGLFGVLAFIVEQRRYEIGVRIALGARSAEVTRMVLRQSLGLSTIGIVAGVATAIMTVTLLQSMLFGLPPIDIPAFGASILVILLATVVASAIPARRATRVDPMVTLRSE